MKGRTLKESSFAWQTAKSHLNPQQAAESRRASLQGGEGEGLLGGRLSVRRAQRRIIYLIANRSAIASSRARRTYNINVYASIHPLYFICINRRQF